MAFDNLTPEQINIIRFLAEHTSSDDYKSEFLYAVRHSGEWAVSLLRVNEKAKIHEDKPISRASFQGLRDLGYITFVRVNEKEIVGNLTQNAFDEHKDYLSKVTNDATEKYQIFINYRHVDSEDITHRIDDHLCQHFGEDNIFLDTRHFDGGEIVEKEALANVVNCSVFIMVVGKDWVSVSTEGIRRIEEPNDLVRREIETAIQYRIPIIPIRVRDASIPKKEELPKSLQPVRDAFWIPVRSGSDFKNDLEDLVKAIEKNIDKEIKKSDSKPKKIDLVRINELADKIGYTDNFSKPPLLADKFVIFSIRTTEKVNERGTKLLKSAREMLNLDNWYTSQSQPNGNHPPKYWAKKIMHIPQNRRAGQKSLIWETNFNSPESSFVFSRLVITDEGEIYYISSQKYVSAYNGVSIFGLGAIVADCWRLTTLALQLYLEIGYRNNIEVCTFMGNTEGTHLGDFANNTALSPHGMHYWADAKLPGIDWSSHSNNIHVCNFLGHNDMKPKVQPDFIQELAEEISLAYNHESPRCFDKETGEIPDEYFKDY